MADILLVLVVFFMSITATEFCRTNQAIHLPDSRESQERKDSSQVIIDVGWVSGLRSGTIRLNNQPVANAEALIPLLHSRLASNPALKVLIRADKNAEYYYVASIMKSCQEAQIPNVTFSVQQVASNL